MTGWETVLGGGGWAGAVMLALFVFKQIYDSWMAGKRLNLEAQAAEHEEVASGVGNATTVNAIMTKSIEALHSENGRLQARNAFLEGQILERDEQIERLKARAVELSQQAAELARELTTYQELLSREDKAGPPDGA